VQSATVELNLDQPEVLEPELSQLLTEFADIFEEPKKLPLVRGHDHKIILKRVLPLSMSDLIIEKDIIEKTVQEMLEAGVIRPS